MSSRSSLSKHLPLIALSLGFVMVIIDVTIVNVALPNMAAHLQGGLSWLQWVVDGYTLTFACLLLTGGNLSDRLSAKFTYLLGLVIFIITSIFCGLANQFLMLTIFRFLQGVGAALIVPTSLSLINASYDKKADRTHAIGIWAMMGGVAAASGPILGGILTTWFTWRAVFFVNVPIGILSLLLVLYAINKPTPQHEGHLDLPGQIMGIISIGALAFGLIEAGRLGFHSPLVITAFTIFILTMIVFIWIEQHSSHPMFPISFFCSSSFTAATLIGMLINFSIYGVIFSLPLYFQQIRHYSIMLTGLAIAPLTALMAVSSYLGGRLASVTGPRAPITIGLGIGAIGFFAMLVASEHTPYLYLMFPLMLMGVGGSFTMTSATIVILTSVPENRTGVASGAFNTSRQLGSLIGVALFGTILNRAAHFISGLHMTFFLSGVAFLLGAIIAWRGIKES